MNAPDQNTIRDYLLGYLPEEQSTTVDEQLFVNEHVLEVIEKVEDELIDEYIEESVSATDKQALEEHFFQPAERLERLRFARMLRSHIQRRVRFRSSD